MSDIADDSDKQVEQFLTWATLNKKPEGPKPTGYCLNCGETIEAPKRWCDADCRDQHQLRAGRLYGTT